MTSPSAISSAMPSFRRRLGAISPAWIVAAPLVQIPAFVSMSMAVRRVAESGADHGLQSGGALWFPDLTHCAIDPASPISLLNEPPSPRHAHSDRFRPPAAHGRYLSDPACM